jgi:hypothetical protein
METVTAAAFAACAGGCYGPPRRARSSGDRACASGAQGRRFDSYRAHPDACKRAEAAFLHGSGVPYGPHESVPCGPRCGPGKCRGAAGVAGSLPRALPMQGRWPTPSRHTAACGLAARPRRAAHQLERLALAGVVPLAAGDRVRVGADPLFAIARMCSPPPRSLSRSGGDYPAWTLSRPGAAPARLYCCLLSSLRGVRLARIASRLDASCPRGRRLRGPPRTPQRSQWEASASGCSVLTWGAALL